MVHEYQSVKIYFLFWFTLNYESASQRAVVLVVNDNAPADDAVHVAEQRELENWSIVDEEAGVLSRGDCGTWPEDYPAVVHLVDIEWRDIDNIVLTAII